MLSEQQVSLKRRYISVRLHSAMLYKAFFFLIVTKHANNQEVNALLRRTNTCTLAFLIEWQPAGHSELFLFGW